MTVWEAKEWMRGRVGNAQNRNAKIKINKLEWQWEREKEGIWSRFWRRLEAKRLLKNRN